MLNNKMQCKNLVDFFINTAKEYPQLPALVLNEKTYTYGDILCRVTRLASVLVSYESEFCGLFIDRSLGAYVGLLAIMMVGKVYVPISLKNPPLRNQALIDFLNLKLMLVDEESKALAKRIFPHFSTDQFVLVNSAGEGLLAAKATENAYLLFTSGTTGEPKAVMTRHQAIIRYIKVLSQRYQFHARDRFSQLMDFSFDVSIHEMFLCWANGACLYPIMEHQIFYSHHFIVKNQITVWTAVPSSVSMMQVWNKVPAGSFQSIRCTIFLGEALNLQIVRYWHLLSPNTIIDNLYGPTEATIIFTAYRYHSDDDAPSGYLPIGYPIDNQPVVVLDEACQPVPQGSVGMLYLGGDQVADGYWSNDRMTKEKFLSLPHLGKQCQWYKTGDYVYWHSQLGLIFKGRETDFLKIRGGRLERLEVETLLRDAAQTDIAAIVTSGEEYSATNQIVAFVGQSPISNADILKHCRLHLPDYMVPAVMIRLDRLPINKNGKVDYHALKSQVKLS